MRLGRTVRVGACALALTLVASFATAPAPARALGPQDLREVSRHRHGRLLELRFRTPAVNGRTAVSILLPAGYDQHSRSGYPMLLLLHGAFGDHTSWPLMGDAEAITRAAPMIVVMPDGGADGAYVDWYNGGAGGRPQWETYHLGQLVPWIDEHFNTVGTRAGRAVAGVSMGGFGAMHYAARHPDMFVSATSWSGAVDTNSLNAQPLSSTAGASGGSPPGAVFGLRASQEIRWRGQNPTDLAANLGGLDLTIRSGDGRAGGPAGELLPDPVEVEVHAESAELDRQLTARGIAHGWDDYGPGGHAWYYWKRGLRQLMPDLRRVFAAAPRPPARVTFRAIEPHYEVYGWTVDVRRPALEFSELHDASRTSFSVLGSGRAIVTTPPVWSPGQGVPIALRRGNSVRRARLRASGDCRLRVATTLGPGNAYQQYTAEARAHPMPSAEGQPERVSGAETAGTAVYAARVTLGAAPGGCRRILGARG